MQKVISQCWETVLETHSREFTSFSLPCDMCACHYWGVQNEVRSPDLRSSRSIIESVLHTIADEVHIREFNSQ